MEIEILTVNFTRVRRDAHETVTPGLAIQAESGWKVTIISNGVGLGKADTLEHAKWLAGAYGGLPIDWTKIPEVKCNDDAVKIVDMFKARLVKFHLEDFYRWMCVMTNEGAR